MPLAKSIPAPLLGALVLALMLLSGVSRSSPVATLVADRLDVLELSSRYAWGIDTVDRAALAQVFTPDAVADYVAVGENPAVDLNEHLVGFEQIYAWLNKTLGKRKGTEGLPVHFVTNQVVELHGDTADLRYYLHNRWMSAGGVYYVKAVRTPAGWRISRLRLEEQYWKPEFYLQPEHRYP